MLQEHPDKELVEYILHGILDGFRIGYDYRKAHCVPAKLNMVSAVTNPQVAAAYLQEEVALGRVVGPLPMGSISV